MATATEGTPGYNEGWFNGDPNRWIEAGSYHKFRDRLPGLKYSEQEIADLDAANEAAEEIRKKNKKAGVEPEPGSDAAHAEKLAAHEEKVAKQVEEAKLAEAEDLVDTKKKTKSKKGKKASKKVKVEPEVSDEDTKDADTEKNVL